MGMLTEQSVVGARKEEEGRRATELGRPLRRALRRPLQFCHFDLPQGKLLAAAAGQGEARRRSAAAAAARRRRSRSTRRARAAWRRAAARSPAAAVA